MPITDVLQLAALIDVVRGLVLTLFVISALLVLLVVLAQEGKGGGLSGAFGGAGAETFGVKAGTVNAFTSWVAAGFLGLALLYAGLRAASRTNVESPGGASTEEFVQGGDGEGAPAGAGGATSGDEAAGGATDGDAADGDAAVGEGGDEAGAPGDGSTPPDDDAAR